MGSGFHALLWGFSFVPRMSPWLWWFNCEHMSFLASLLLEHTKAINRSSVILCHSWHLSALLKQRTLFAREAHSTWCSQLKYQVSLHPWHHCPCLHSELKSNTVYSCRNRTYPYTFLMYWVHIQQIFCNVLYKSVCHQHGFKTVILKGKTVFETLTIKV